MSSASLSLFFVGKEVGGETAGAQGDEEGQQGKSSQDYGGGVKDVADADEGRYDGAEDVADYAEECRCCAGGGAPFVHGKGVGGGEDHPQGEAYGEEEEFDAPEAVDEP